MKPLLSIQDLKVAFRMGKAGGVMQRQLAVKGISFDVPENSTVALVGESGSGKSVTAMSILNLLPENAERQGAISFQGRDLLAASLTELQAMRGKDIACVFQDPMTSLNPVFTIGQQISETVWEKFGSVSCGIAISRWFDKLVRPDAICAAVYCESAGAVTVPRLTSPPANSHP